MNAREYHRVVHFDANMISDGTFGWGIHLPRRGMRVKYLAIRVGKIAVSIKVRHR